MTMDRRSPPPQQLPERVIALLSRPRLTTLPENPVGEVWQRIHAALGSPEVLALPEILEATALAALLGDDAAQRPDVHRIGDGRLLRFDQTAPLLLAARGRPVGATLAAAGKVYRAVDRDHGHLQAFHQAELLWLRDRAQRWSPMGPLEAVVDAVLPGAGLRVESADYALYGDRGYSVAVERHGRWHAIAGWARFSSRIVTALGHDPTRTCAFGLGLGLERLAAVVFDIDDVRRVAASRVDEP
jgi:phenylalanyl-tRNA synthetase alpha chain